MKNSYTIKVKSPIVECDGDEMAHIIWKLIKTKVGARIIHFDHLLMFEYFCLVYIALSGYRHKVFRFEH